jgi:hypothetical protein
MLEYVWNGMPQVNGYPSSEISAILNDFIREKNSHIGCTSEKMTMCLLCPAIMTHCTLLSNKRYSSNQKDIIDEAGICEIFPIWSDSNSRPYRSFVIAGAERRA